MRAAGCALPVTRALWKAGSEGGNGLSHAGCNVRQEHSADGTVQLLIDCVLRNPRGCGRQSGELTAELRLDEVSLQCSGSVDISADDSEYDQALEVSEQSLAAQYGLSAATHARFSVSHVKEKSWPWAGADDCGSGDL